jgi:pimeloyl-ACP methyl ester carboxylesterase
MDGFKESRVPLYGDRWLNRGIAVLSVEGPGEWECPLRGIHVSVENWEAAGPAMYAWLAARPEIDPHKIAIIGTSFGSFFNTIAITAEPRYAACAVQGTVYEPGCHAIFEEASPTFKERFIFMSGYNDEAAFDRFAKTLTLEGRAARVGCPYLCLSGEADELSPSHDADWLFGGMHVPRTLVVYADSRHSLAGPSVNLGPQPGPLLSDWVAARFAGKPLASEHWYVDSGGRVTKTNYA